MQGFQMGKKDVCRTYTVGYIVHFPNCINAEMRKIHQPLKSEPVGLQTRLNFVSVWENQTWFEVLHRVFFIKFLVGGLAFGDDFRSPSGTESDKGGFK